MTATADGFSKWRRRLWPVHSFELRKIIPLFLLKFLISVNYTLLYGLKDTVVVTNKHSGAEVIPVLKGWIVLPISILVVMLYSKLTNKYKLTTLIYSSISFFLGFAALYSFVLYPNMDAISPTASADWFLETFGQQYSHWVAVYRNWANSLFYINAEMWSTIVIFVLYWGFTNQINTVSEAKRTYSIFIAAGDIGAMVPGPIVYYFCTKYAHLDFAFTLQALTCIILLVGVGILTLFWYLNTYVVTDRRLVSEKQLEEGIKSKNKLSLMQSIKYIVQSKYLLSIAVLVIGCALSINMVEVTWKANLRELYPVSADYYAYLNSVTTTVGAIALVTVLFFGGNSLRKFGWYFNAQVAPIIIGATGILFFLMNLYPDTLQPICKAFNVSPLTIIVFFGAFQFIAAKAVKYSFFDSTKEMVFIPLDRESKTKGKAAIDVVGSRLGKSGSSWVQIALIELVGTGSVLSVTPFLVPFVVLTIVSWMFAVRNLNKEFARQEEAIATA